METSLEFCSQRKSLQGISTLRELFEDFRIYREVRALIIVERVQANYTEERVVRVVGEKKTQSYMINNPGIYGEVLNDVTVGDFDVRITDVSFEKTIRQQSWTDISEMLKTFGADLPPSIKLELLAGLFENSTMTNGDEYAEKIRAQIPGAQQMEQAMQQQAMQGGGAPNIPQNPGFAA